MKRIAPCASFLLAASAATALTPIQETAVSVGGNPTVDACSLGKIIGLDPASVLTAPKKNGYPSDRRLNGQFVYVCTERGRYFGVVYHPSGKQEGCGVTSPIRKKGPYKGPCKSG